MHSFLGPDNEIRCSSTLPEKLDPPNGSDHAYRVGDGSYHAARVENGSHYADRFVNASNHADRVLAYLARLSEQPQAAQ